MASGGSLRHKWGKRRRNCASAHSKQHNASSSLNWATKLARASRSRNGRYERYAVYRFGCQDDRLTHSEWISDRYRLPRTQPRCTLPCLWTCWYIEQDNGPTQCEHSPNSQSEASWWGWPNNQNQLKHTTAESRWHKPPANSPMHQRSQEQVLQTQQELVLPRHLADNFSSRWQLPRRGRTPCARMECLDATWPTRVQFHAPTSARLQFPLRMGDRKICCAFRWWRTWIRRWPVFQAWAHQECTILSPATEDHLIPRLQ